MQPLTINGHKRLVNGGLHQKVTSPLRRVPCIQVSAVSSPGSGSERVPHQYSDPALIDALKKASDPQDGPLSGRYARIEPDKVPGLQKLLFARVLDNKKRLFWVLRESGWTKKLFHAYSVYIIKKFDILAQWFPQAVADFKEAEFDEGGICYGNLFNNLVWMIRLIAWHEYHEDAKAWATASDKVRKANLGWKYRQNRCKREQALGKKNSISTSESRMNLLERIKNWNWGPRYYNMVEEAKYLNTSSVKTAQGNIAPKQKKAPKKKKLEDVDEKDQTN